MRDFFSLTEKVKPSIKYQVIFKNKDKYSIKQMREIFRVSRIGYYSFLKRLNNIRRFTIICTICGSSFHGLGYCLVY